MAKLFTVNQTPLTWAAAMFILKTQLKTAGWTVTKSSDGTTYNASADQIDNGTSAVNGMDRAYAWFVIQMPGCSRSFCIQRNSSTAANSSNSWRIKYSKIAGFATGSPSATQTPTATDEEVLLGNAKGGDAAPTFNIIAPVSCFGDGGTFRFNCFADNAAPYGFMSWSWQNTTGFTGHAFGIDPLQAAVAIDTDPYVVHATANLAIDVPFKTTAILGGGTQLSCWANTLWCRGGATKPFPCAGTPQPYGGSWLQCSDNIINGNKDDILPLTVFIYWQDVVPYFYYKGILTYTRAVAQIGRYSGDLYTIAATKDGVCVGNCILPWDGSSIPLV